MVISWNAAGHDLKLRGKLLQRGGVLRLAGEIVVFLRIGEAPERAGSNGCFTGASVVVGGHGFTRPKIVPRNWFTMSDAGALRFATTGAT